MESKSEYKCITLPLHMKYISLHILRANSVQRIRTEDVLESMCIQRNETLISLAEPFDRIDIIDRIATDIK